MTVSLGQIVMHPQHGAVTVDRQQRRTVGDREVDFFVFTDGDGLSVMIPCDAVEESGIRPCMRRAEVKAVEAALADQPRTMKGSWSRKLKRNRERLGSGDPTEVAGVVRDLAAKEADKGLSHAERMLYRDARRMLQGELAAVLEGGAEAAEKLVDEAIAPHLETEDAAA